MRASTPPSQTHNPHTSPPHRPPILPPNTWVAHRYRIKRPLSRGGFSHVYLATSGLTGRLVALKILHAHPDDPEQLARLRREAQIGQALKDPRSVRVLDWGQDPLLNILFLCMEYIQGEPLSDRLHGHQRLPTHLAIWIAHEVATALTEAHNLGLIHRDIKPDNIMLTQHNGHSHIKVIDFGIAHRSPLPPSSPLLLPPPPDSIITANETILGTTHYLSPEQALREPLTPQTDQYALAVTTFEMLTGSPPFHHSNPISLIHLHLHTPPPSLSQACPGLPLAHTLNPILQRALSKDPSHRFPSILDFTNALTKALQTLDSPLPDPTTEQDLIPLNPPTQTPIHTAHPSNINTQTHTNTETLPPTHPTPISPQHTHQPPTHTWPLFWLPALSVVVLGLLVQWLSER
jgi:serine/threonine protein kinase